MAHRSGPTKRDLFPGTGAGKGDADRSPKWRDHYDEINWTESDDSVWTEVRPGRYRKIYGTTEIREARPSIPPDAEGCEALAKLDTIVQHCAS